MVRRHRESVTVSGSDQSLFLTNHSEPILGVLLKSSWLVSRRTSPAPYQQWTELETSWPLLVELTLTTTLMIPTCAACVGVVWTLTLTLVTMLFRPPRWVILTNQWPISDQSYSSTAASSHLEEVRVVRVRSAVIKPKIRHPSVVAREMVHVSPGPVSQSPWVMCCRVSATPAGEHLMVSQMWTMCLDLWWTGECSFWLVD